MAVKEPRRAGPRSKRRTLKVGVVWADFSKIVADVLLVGHYIGVLPQRAEHQLDRIVSDDDGKTRKLVITELTRRGVVRGELGEIALFPGPEGRLIAVAGLGRPGTFGRSQARVLARNVAQVIGLLPRHRNIATVLVGSGEGNLTVHEAVGALLEGLIETLNADPQLELDSVQIVEQRIDRALDIQEAVKAVAKRLNAISDSGVAIVTGRDMPTGSGHEIPERFGCAMLLAALAKGGGPSKRLDTRKIIEVALAEVPAETREKVRGYLKRAIGHRKSIRASSLRELARQFRLRDADDIQPSLEVPSRLAFWCSADAVHGSAITHTTTVTERAISRRVPFVEHASERLQRPKAAEWERQSSTLYQLLVPAELREVWERPDALVIEVDATLARVQWEMLPGRDGRPQGVERMVARQLRTLYSPRPVETTLANDLRALIIGDPGGPEATLPAAQEEALAVAALLKAQGIESTLLIGAPEDGTDAGPVDGVAPADYFDVVESLVSGRFDIVHYCGHAVFDPATSDRTGWLFKADNLLTAAELNGMKRPPRLVFANACLTAQLGQQTGRTRASTDSAALSRGDPRLVASLADEFFKQGVYDYIGTAWEVESKAALLFAKAFYSALLGDRSQFVTLGEAMKSARTALYLKRKTLGMGWAAYQHYGDPTRTLRRRPGFA